MTQSTLIPEYRFGDRGRLVAGDTFRARGGPVFRGVRVGHRGLFRLVNVERDHGRTCLVAMQVDRHGLPSGGVVTLYVEGVPVTLGGLVDWICRPYRIQKRRECVE